VYALPTGTLTNAFPFGAGLPFEITLSGAGNLLGIASTSDAEVIAVTGGTTVWAGTANLAVEISPDGTLVAVASEARLPTTTIYTNGALTTAVNGAAVGWLDDTRLLVENFKTQDEIPEPV
jgi:hypothetical protein